MLQLDHKRLPTSLTNDSGPDRIDARSLLRIARRQWPILVGSTALFLALGFAYVVLATPRYSASFLVMMETPKSEILAKNETASIRPNMIDPGFVESQIELLQSDSVARSVVRKLNLTSDSNFAAPSALAAVMEPVIKPIVALFGQNSGPPTETDLENAAVKMLIAGLKVKRRGITYVIEVTYTGRNAELSAKIANELANTYMLGELEAKYQATKRVTKWLQDRIYELQQAARTADQAVQQFKAENNIVDTSRGFMNEQELSDVNAQLVAARAATAEAKARLDRVNEISRSDVIDGSVADALRSDIITRLRAQYLDIAAREAELSRKYGEDHRTAVNLRNQMNDLRRSVRDEFQRIADASRSDYEIALAREKSLQQSLELLVAQASTSNQAQVKLRDLESSAATYRNLYTNFLQKFQETTQQQTFPVPDARVIAPALIPDKPSWPKKILVLPGSAVLGFILGFALVLTREMLGNGFHSAEDVQKFAGLEYLGALPNLAKADELSRKPISATNGDLTDASNFAMHALAAPFSRFTETIRNVKVSIDLASGHNKPAVVSVVSALPHEGKTTVTANLALLTAQMGQRTLLIDCDLHNPSLTRLLMPNATTGVIEILSKGATLADVVKKVVPNLEFVPAVVPERQPNSVTLLTSPEMSDLLTSVRSDYDFILIDMPPVVPVVDVKAAGHLIDHFVFLIEWGQTTRDAVRDALSSSVHLRKQVIGAVLNKAPPSALKRYEAYKGRHYHNYYAD